MTSHFRRAEFAQPAKRGFFRVEYPVEWLDRLEDLCCQLEAIRAKVARPLHVLSGYRTPAYNRAVGGARRSQHMEGRAADIKAFGLSAQRLHDHILQLYSQGVLHIGGLGLYPTWVHVDIRPNREVRLARWRG